MNMLHLFLSTASSLFDSTALCVFVIYAGNSHRQQGSAWKVEAIKRKISSPKDAYFFGFIDNIP